MDKLLEVLAEVVKLLFGVSPATAVLFIVACALVWYVRQLAKKNDELNTAAVAREERVQTQLTAALAEKEKAYEKKLDEKECEIKLLHERGVQRDKEVSGVISNLTRYIQLTNSSPLQQSIWNGVVAILRTQELDPQASGLYQHLNQNQPQLPVLPTETPL